MISPKIDTAFAGSIPALYQRYLVPLIFESYAADLALRVLQRQPARVLEIAAGTGVVTRQLAATLPPDIQIVATDLNQPMLDHAATLEISRLVEWRQADAMQLPFQDEMFDVVVCQFGVMFFPDKAKAFSEARRVLRAGGYLLFNVWDEIKENEFADTVTRALETVFPSDPPRFMVRIPHGYHDLSTIAQDLRRGGFTKQIESTTLAARSRAGSPRIPAIAYCHGTPLRGEMEARDPSRLAEATDTAEHALRKRFGPGPVDGKIQALIIASEC
jgi:ubiquinone/menaquinone biosynthesis C-methylase UbiE